MGRTHLALSLRHQWMRSMGPSRGKISVQGFIVRSLRPLRSEPSHPRLTMDFKDPRRTDQGPRGNLLILTLWLSNNPQTGTNSEHRALIPLSVGPERRRLVGWSRGECTIVSSFRSVPRSISLLPSRPHRLRFHRLSSLKSHVVTQFSASYYDACVLACSSILRTPSHTIILSCLLSLPLHYITGPHVVCAKSFLRFLDFFISLL